MIVSELVSLLGFKVDESGARQFDAKLNQLQQNASSAADNIKNVFQITAAGITAAFAGMALTFGKPIAEAGDAMNTSLAKIETSIGRSATSASEAEDIYNKLFEAGQRTGVGADESAGAFVRFNLAMQDVGRPATDTIKLIEGIQAAGIVAGTTTAELTGSMLQLGQALGSGKLQGDELKSLRENMPTLLRDLVKELGITQKEFFAQAEKGLLTPERIIPGLLKAGETATKELANFPVTMGRAYAILTGSVTRFLAELDKQLNLSKTIARVFIYIAQTLNSWRAGLSVIGDLVREMGGLEGIARLVGIALLVAFGQNILSAIGGLITLFNVMGAAVLRAFLPLTLFALFVLTVEDFIGWIQGKNSIFGDLFGDFDTLVAPLRPQLEAVKKWFEDNLSFGELIDNTKREFNSIATFFSDLWQGIKDVWNSNVEGMKPQFEWLRGAAGFLMDAFRPLGDFFKGVFEVILRNINGFYDRVVVVVNGIRSAISALLGLIPGLQSATEGAGTGGDPVGQEARRKNFGGRGALENFVNPALAGELGGLLGGLAPIPDVSGRVGTSTNNINSSQSNNIPVEININAPGADPASIASGVNAGLGRATENMTTRLGSSMALGLGISSPRVEAPASP